MQNKLYSLVAALSTTLSNDSGVNWEWWCACDSQRKCTVYGDHGLLSGRWPADLDINDNMDILSIFVSVSIRIAYTCTESGQ